MVLNVWSTLAVFCILGVALPSVRIFLFSLPLSEKLTSILFPLRTLLGKKIRRKNDMMAFYTDIRQNGGVNSAAVIWYCFAVLAVIVLLVFTLAGLLTESFVSMFNQVVIIAFIVCLILVVVGVFFGDRKFRNRYDVTTADPEKLHEIEQEIAYMVRDRIEEDQAVMKEKGYRFVIDILCTDHLSDTPNPALKGVFTPFMGIGNTNPVYISHADVRVLNDDGEEIPFPVKRRNSIDISYTQGKILIVFDSAYVADQIVRLVHDLTKMF